METWLVAVQAWTDRDPLSGWVWRVQFFDTHDEAYAVYSAYRAKSTGEVRFRNQAMGRVLNGPGGMLAPFGASSFEL